MVGHLVRHLEASFSHQAAQEAQNAIKGSKALHTRQWQTKDGTYRLKRHALLDVRDAPVDYDNAAASSTDANPQWRNWNEDYAMGYQLHPKLSWTRDTLSLPGGVQHMSASGVSLSFHHMSHHLLTLAAGRFFFVVCVSCVFCLGSGVCFLFCKCHGISHSSAYIKSR